MKVACERPDGTLNIHSEGLTCEVCTSTDHKMKRPLLELLKWGGWLLVAIQLVWRCAS